MKVRQKEKRMVRLRLATEMSVIQMNFISIDYHLMRNCIILMNVLFCMIICYDAFFFFFFDYWELFYIDSVTSSQVGIKNYIN